MCELLGISSLQPAQWRDTLAVFRQRGGATADNPDGWGLAWRERDAWQLQKAPEAAAQSAEFAAWTQTLSTNLLIGHARKANPPQRQRKYQYPSIYTYVLRSVMGLCA